MKRLLLALFVVVGGSLSLIALAAEETKVELKQTHVCCQNCVKSVAAVLAKAGVKGSANQDDHSIQFTAADEKTAQKTLDALTAAGFHGVVESETLKVKDDSGVKAGKVKSLSLKGVHNCCGSCNAAIKAAIKKVPGVESEDVKPRAEKFTVTGDFDAEALVKALNDAGFHGQVAE
jgi:periplasmic mercuric ion binding protein